MKIYFTLLLISFLNILQAQTDYWQQEVAYTMEIDFDVESHQFDGEQTLVYTNHSPDTLHKVFYHLFYNAFQPGSMMDVRSRTIADPDSRVMDRIEALKENEIGYQHILSLDQDGRPTNYIVDGTVLEVRLPQPILPGKQSVFKMKFKAQVPLQVRRTGRDNKEGISYSMSQWYPKLAEYDEEGWHPDEYIAREFHGVWGSFDVSITIDSDYIIGGTGHLQNANKIGYGYSSKKVKHKKRRPLTWRFKADKVHDFVWAADPDYEHITHTAYDGTEMHFLYQKSNATKEWEKLPAIMAEAFGFVSENFGKYPYDIYSFIQGGDGGMEYPMATLITGERSLGSLVGVSVHELMHSWYQMVLASNEGKYAWMDEGFTSFASTLVMNHLRSKKLIGGTVQEFPFKSSYDNYRRLVNSGVEEPLTTHADHFNVNFAYSIASYVKGAIYLHQMEYIIGKENFDAGLLRYFNTWKFKHPNADRVTRVFEKQSDFILDWYQEYWVNGTKSIDYGIDSVSAKGSQQSVVYLKRYGLMPMPIDIYVTLKNGREIAYTIPLRMMRNHKVEEMGVKYTVAEDWSWVNPSYELNLDIPLDQIEKVEIDKTQRLADISVDNNQWTQP
ncbi:M1 family metallopeptidase [Membranihabitans marinus]|uniref:M1 family metallopeptidase n=1 Tax=Membranihabitans marinus TaxID=1227546 RepID=UPI001F1C08EE|nr:M1 family metallopeptidase [Membranihabitans marinus]